MVTRDCADVGQWQSFTHFWCNQFQHFGGARGLADVDLEPKEDRMRRERIYRLRGRIPAASFQRLKAAVDQKPASDGPTKHALVLSELSAKLARLERYERRALSRRRKAIRLFDEANKGAAAVPP